MQKLLEKNCPLRPMQRFDGRRLWLHCICCHMTARSRQRAHKHNPRSNLFGSFIVDTTHILASAKMASLYLVFSQQRSCGNVALIQHTAHSVSSLKEYNCDCVALVQPRDSTHDFNTRSGGALRLPFLDSERRSESIFGIQSAPRFQALYGDESVPRFQPIFGTQSAPPPAFKLSQPYQTAGLP